MNEWIDELASDCLNNQIDEYLGNKLMHDFMNSYPMTELFYLIIKKLIIIEENIEILRDRKNEQMELSEIFQ